jgi:hypothetical protein
MKSPSREAPAYGRGASIYEKGGSHVNKKFTERDEERGGRQHHGRELEQAVQLFEMIKTTLFVALDS